jgi:hypothetical protein
VGGGLDSAETAAFAVEHDIPLIVVKVLLNFKIPRYCFYCKTEVKLFGRDGTRKVGSLPRGLRAEDQKVARFEPPKVKRRSGLTFYSCLFLIEFSVVRGSST